MKKYLLLSTVFVSGCSGIFGGGAPERIQPTPPAETPPSSYSQDEYMDSRGCLYIRSAVNSAQWFPRVTPQGSHMCNTSPASQFSVGPGVDDIHDAFVQEAVTTPEAPKQAEQTVSQEVMGGLQLGSMFDRLLGNKPESDVKITGEISGLPEETKAEAVEVVVKPAPVVEVPKPVVVEAPVAVEVQAPTPVVEAPKPVVVQAPAPVVEAPKPVVVEAPAPVVQAPAPVVQAPAQTGGRRVFTSGSRTTPNATRPAPVQTQTAPVAQAPAPQAAAPAPAAAPVQVQSANTAMVQVGTFADAAARDAAVSKLRAAGYSVSVRQSGQLSVVVATGKSGQSSAQLLQAILAMGFSDASSY